MQSSAQMVPATDGRRARGERTRTRVLEALLNLVEEGEVRPTAQDVADRAGVALRTVYHHFEDVEELRALALDLQLERNFTKYEPIEPSLPLEERVKLFVRQCRKFYEAVSPIRRAVLVDEPMSTTTTAGIRRARMARRAQIEHTFGREMNSDRRAQLDAADAVSSWPTWNYLRETARRSPAAAESVTISTLLCLFANTSKPRR